jgi:hypothetical protein
MMAERAASMIEIYMPFADLQSERIRRRAERGWLPDPLGPDEAAMTYRRIVC